MCAVCTSSALGLPTDRPQSLLRFIGDRTRILLANNSRVNYPTKEVVGHPVRCGRKGFGNCNRLLVIPELEHAVRVRSNIRSAQEDIRSAQEDIRRESSKTSIDAQVRR